MCTFCVLYNVAWCGMAFRMFALCVFLYAQKRKTTASDTKLKKEMQMKIAKEDEMKKCISILTAFTLKYIDTLLWFGPIWLVTSLPVAGFTVRPTSIVARHYHSSRLAFATVVLRTNITKPHYRHSYLILFVCVRVCPPHVQGISFRCVCMANRSHMATQHTVWFGQLCGGTTNSAGPHCHYHRHCVFLPLPASPLVRQN